MKTEICHYVFDEECCKYCVHHANNIANPEDAESLEPDIVISGMAMEDCYNFELYVCPNCGEPWEADSEAFGCWSCGFIKESEE